MSATRTTNERPLRAALQSERGAIGTRFAATLAAALLLSALALCGAAIIATVRAKLNPSTAVTSAPAGAIGIRLNATQPVLATFTVRTNWYIRDEDILFAFVVAALAWLLLTGRIWRPILRKHVAARAVMTTLWMGWLVLIGAAAAESRVFRSMFSDELLLGGPIALASMGTLFAWARAYSSTANSRVAGANSTITWLIVKSILVGICTLIGAVLVDRGVRFQEEIFIAATICGGTACFILLWLPLIARLEIRPVRDLEGEVLVHCPRCGYSLVGLTELRCPECGERFTLDQVIAAQGYPERGPVD